MSPLASPSLLSATCGGCAKAEGDPKAGAHLAILHVLVGSVFEQSQGGLHVVDSCSPV